jgi:hypothetical protein
MSKSTSKRPVSEYICKPHKVMYLKSGYRERICEVSGKTLGWADEPKKRKGPKKGARMRAKLSLKKATDE